MEIQRYRDENGKIMNKPKYKEDIFLFHHCSNGLSSVTTRFLNAYVWPMLQIHNMNTMQIMNIVKKTKVKYNKKKGHLFALSDNICTLCGHSKFYVTNYNTPCPGKMAW